MEPSKKPVNLLIKKVNQEVAVKLKNHLEYRGKMIDCDSHMNLILEGATEYRDEEATANFGNIIVRGNNVLYVCIERPS
ncbi:LSM domain-containing protein [[Eubacterium] cellulosolvens]